MSVHPSSVRPFVNAVIPLGTYRSSECLFSILSVANIICMYLSARAICSSQFKFVVHVSKMRSNPFSSSIPSFLLSFLPHYSKPITYPYQLCLCVPQIELVNLWWMRFFLLYAFMFPPRSRKYPPMHAIMSANSSAIWKEWIIHISEIFGSVTFLWPLMSGHWFVQMLVGWSVSWQSTRFKQTNHHYHFSIFYAFHQVMIKKMEGVGAPLTF